MDRKDWEAHQTKWHVCRHIHALLVSSRKRIFPFKDGHEQVGTAISAPHPKSGKRPADPKDNPLYEQFPAARIILQTLFHPERGRALVRRFSFIAGEPNIAKS